MRLTRVRVLDLRAPVRGLAGAARGAIERRSLILSVADGEACWGQGEASPLPGFSHDTVEAAAAELARLDPAAWPAPDQADPLEWSQTLLANAGLRSPAARFALETAVLDWLARVQGVPLARVLGAGEPPRAIPVSSLVSDLAAARAALVAGVVDLKLKIEGGNPAPALSLAGAIRDEFGALPRLRFDANRSLTLADAPAVLEALAALGAEFIEEPVSWRDLPALGGAALPLAADESLADPLALATLAECCAVWVLKPTLLGGLHATREWALRARALGKAVVVTHTFDGPIAQAASAELVAALSADGMGAPLTSGLGAHAALSLWGMAGWPVVEAGRLAVARAPGLGLPDALGGQA